MRKRSSTSVFAMILWLIGLGGVSLGFQVATGYGQEPTTAALSATSRAESRPNVILILADDLALGDLGSTGISDTKKHCRTPNLDQLAQESIRFSQAYSGSCVCAPARAALLTGRYPHRTGVVTLNMNRYPKMTRLRRDEITIADVLKNSGYATGLIGKWHVGRGQGYHPLDRGFDEFQGFGGSSNVGYFRYPLTTQRTVSMVEDGYLTDDLNQRAIDYVRRHRDQPFFLHLAHYAPHRPLEAPQDLIRHYLDMGHDESVSTIYAMIEVMDRGIGRLLRELETLGIAENTIVIFASDNGPDPLTGERYNRELRGTKYQVYEGGIRVPLWIRWRAKFDPGQRDQVVSFTDVLPTLLDLCNVSRPPANPMDGKSFAGVLRDKDAVFSNPHFWQWNRGSPNYTHNAALRNGRFKLVRPYVTRGSKVVDSDSPTVLYDLQSDPTESKNVIDQHPELADQMKQQLQELSSDIEQDRNRKPPVSQSNVSANTPPNIVFILADDLGWSDLGCYGHPYHRTPHLDRLASQGMRFTNGYSPAPICSAARASILTGKTPARLGFEFVTKNAPGHQQLDTEVPLQTPRLTLNLPVAEWTVAEQLANQGYLTAFFGKWHVSQHYQGRYLAWHPDYGPSSQGFQIATEDFGDHPYAWGKTKPTDLDHGTFPSDSMVRKTANFIRRQSKSDQPFFLMASSFYVHTPVKNRCRWLVDHYDQMVDQDAPNRNKRLEYAAFVETLDHHVGTILDAIEDSGQSENTLVVFMSDNGGHPEFCANAPLRGSKWNLYEGGIRVPFLVRWPEKIAPNSISKTPVIGYDLMPTFAHVSGGGYEGGDGIDLSPVFSDHQWSPTRDLLWHFPYYHPERTFSKAIETIGVNDFKTSQTRPQSALRHNQFKLLHFAEDDRIELYDLTTDLSEQQDLSQSQPQIAARLRTKLNQTLNAMDARRAEPK